MHYRVAGDGRSPDEIASGEMYVTSPLFRTLIAKVGGRVAQAFTTENHGTRMLGNVENWDLPDELLAEALFAYGYKTSCVRIMENSAHATALVCDIDSTQPGLSEFVALAQSIRARKLIESVMREIKNV